MADEAPPPRILADPQDPLPEASWLWRRVFTFAVLAATVILALGLAIAVNRIVGNIVGRLDTMDARNVAAITIKALEVILRMFTLMVYVWLANMLLYIVAPSAEQITKMLQTARLLKSGVQVATRARARGRGVDREEETAATIGIPPQPHVPPPLARPEVASDEEDYAPRSRT